jgi:ankyrin repeat protein
MVGLAKIGLAAVSVSLVVMSGSALGKGTKPPSDDVPAEFAYTKTSKYRRFMALVAAAEKGNARSARALIRGGVDVDGRDVGDDVAPTNRPLAVAAEHGHLDVVELLLAAGARPDWCCCSCVTALHYAIRGGHAKIVARLLDAGADPTRRYDGKLSPLELARQAGNPEIVRLLEERLTRR